MLFACVGTTISTFVVATIMYFLSYPISDTVPVRFLDALFFGAVISATDPVTVLSIFHDLHVDSTLNGLILGESLLNDAVAVVLVAAIEEYTRASLTQGDSFELDALLVTLIRLCIIVVGSIGLGAAVAMVTSILTKFTK